MKFPMDNWMHEAHDEVYRMLAERGSNRPTGSVGGSIRPQYVAVRNGGRSGGFGDADIMRDGMRWQVRCSWMGGEWVKLYADTLADAVGLMVDHLSDPAAMGRRV